MKAEYIVGDTMYCSKWYIIRDGNLFAKSKNGTTFIKVVGLDFRVRSYSQKNI